MPLDPLTLSPLAWYDPSDAATLTMSGPNVVGVADKSGNGRNAAPEGGSVVTLGTQNGKATFDCGAGTGSFYWSGSVFHTGTALSAVLVFKRETGSARGLGLTNGTQDWENLQSAAIFSTEFGSFPVCKRNTVQLSGTDCTFDEWHIGMSIFDGTNHTMYVDGVAFTPAASTGAFNLTRINVASHNGSERWSGELGDVFVIPTALNSTQRSDLLTYLEDKWINPPGATFTTGRMWDDENGTDTIDIAADGYTELEWNLKLQAPAADVYEFRVYAGSTPFATYTVTPQLTAAVPINLVVANGLHAHVAGNVPLVVDLVVANAAHVLTSDNVTVTEVVNLVVAGSVHALASGIPTLVVEPVVQHAAHALTSTNVALVVDLVVANAAQTVVSQQVVLVVDLAVNNAAHQSTSDSVTLSMEGALDVHSATHQHTANEVALTQLHVLAVDNAVHAHTAGSATLYPVPDLVVAAGSHTHTAANVVLEVVAAAANTAHAHSADTPTLYPVPNLVVAAGVHAHTATSVALEVTLAVQSATHAHTAGSPTLIVEPVVQSAAHAVTSTNVIITPGLLVDNAKSLVTSDEMSLAGVPLLTVQPGVHAHTASNVTPLGVSLFVQDAAHAHTAANVALVVDLAVQGTAHAVTSPNLELTQLHVLVVASSAHLHSALGVVLYPVPLLVVAAGVHEHSAAHVELTQDHFLALDSAEHAHAAVSVALELVLVVAATAHALSSTQVDMRGSTVLNDALALYLGAVAVQAAYVGATKVWP
jgi:hypothetical protein